MRKVRRLPIISTRLSYAVENNGKYDEYILPHLYPQAIKPDQYIMDYLRKKFPNDQFEFISPPQRDDLPPGGAMQIEEVPLNSIPIKETTKAALLRNKVYSTICELNVNDFGSKFKRFMYALADLLSLPVTYEDRWGVEKRMTKWQSFKVHLFSVVSWFKTLFDKESYFRDIARVQYVGVTVGEEEMEQGLKRLAKALDAVADRNLIFGTLAPPMRVELVNTVGNGGRIFVIVCYVAIYPDVDLQLLTDLTFQEGGLPTPAGGKMPYSELKGEIYDITEDIKNEPKI